MDNLRCLRSPCLLDFLSGKLSGRHPGPLLGITYLSNHLGPIAGTRFQRGMSSKQRKHEHDTTSQ